MTPPVAGPKLTRARTSSLSIATIGAVVAFAAAFTVLKSQAWIPFYARSIMPDALIDGDRITTPPLVEVQDGHIRFPDRKSDSVDSAKSGNIAP